MDAADLAATMLLCPDLLDDETLLLFSMTEQKEPMHYKYERFDSSSITEEEFKFEKKHISSLRRLLGLREKYTSETNLTWKGDEGLCILLRL